MADDARTPSYQDARAVCGRIVEKTAQELVARGATLNQVVERMLFFCAVQLHANLGAADAAELFRDMGDVVERGDFAAFVAALEARMG